MDKMNLAEATMLALQGKLELNENKASKVESIDITANNGTYVSVDDKSTYISSPEASISIVNDASEEDVVELPVVTDDTVIPEDTVDSETFTDDILPDDEPLTDDANKNESPVFNPENMDENEEELGNKNESVDVTGEINITKYDDVKNLASEIANSLKDKEDIKLNDVITAIENWDNGKTTVFTVISKIDSDLANKLDNEDNKYEVENQFLGLVEDCLADMGKTVFDDNYYGENKKIESIENKYSFEELYSDMEDAETYDDLYSCMLHIKNQNLRDEAFAHIEQSEKDGDTVQEACSMVMSDVLEKYRFKDNSVNLQEKSCKLAEVSDLKYDVLTDREIDMANTDLNMILDDVKDNTIRPATIKSAEALLSNLIFWFKEANPDYNYKLSYIGESKKLHESANSPYDYMRDIVKETAQNLDSINGNNTYSNLIADAENLNTIVDDVMEDDELWNKLDETIRYYLDNFSKTENKTNNKLNKKSKKLHESDDDDSLHEEAVEAIESAKYTLEEIYDQVTRAAYSWDGLDDDIKNVLEDELSNSFGDDLQDASDTISDFMDSWDSYESDFIEELYDIYESRKRDEEDEEDEEDDDLDEAKSAGRNPKVNLDTFEKRLNEFYKRQGRNNNIKIDAVYMSPTNIKLEGHVKISDKINKKIQLEMKHLNTFKNKSSYELTSTGRSIKTESAKSQMVMTITNTNNVIECNNIFNRKNK